MAVRGKGKGPKPLNGRSSGYSLRSEAPDDKSSITPKRKKDLFLTPGNSPAIDATANFVCDICKGNESIRNANLQDTIKNFSDQIEQLTTVTKILKDSNSDINHMSDALKHFIMTFDPKTINDDFSNIFTNLSELSKNFTVLSDIVPNFSEIENLLTRYVEKQDSYNAKTEKLYEEAIALNNKKLSQISLEIESLKSHIQEFKSNSTASTSDNIDIKHKDGQLFTCNEVGQHVINKSYTLDENPTLNIESYQDSCIPEDLKCSIISYLSENFNNDKVEGKHIAVYGHNLLYLKANKKSKSPDIPNTIKDMIRLVDPENVNKINSVIITKYSNDSSSIESSFTDKCITPESDISTISIGGKLNVAFRDKVTGTEKSLDLEDASCFAMSQQSQFYWSHKVTCQPNISETPQYSITLLCTGRNHNSTLIVGDSNTFNIKFHNESSYYSNLGKEISGKRYICYLIEHVDPLKCLGYRNIIFHIGINNLKDRYHGLKNIGGHVDIQPVFDSWLTTVIKLRNLCPYSRIIVSPILPTKIKELNNRAIRFNSLIFNCANKFWSELNFNSFVNSSGLLDDNFGRRYNVNTGFRDRIHLGMLGISRLGLLFRDAILGRSGKVDGRLYIDVVRGSGNSHVS